MRILQKLFGITDKKFLNAFSQAGTIGLHMVSGIAVGAVVGYLLDRWLDTRPWLTVIFLVVGIVAGFKNVYVDSRRLIAAQQREEEEEDRRKREQTQGGQERTQQGYVRKDAEKGPPED